MENGKLDLDCATNFFAISLFSILYSKKQKHAKLVDDKESKASYITSGIYKTIQTNIR